MPFPLPIRCVTSLALVAAALCAGAAQATAAGPDASAMIEALQPAAGGSRNLLVRLKPDVAASATAAKSSLPADAPGAVDTAGPPPSLSLAIEFEPNSSAVRPASGPLLGNLVAAMLSPELRSRRFLIEGHTDARGAAAADQRLSQQRAEEVRLYLVALGVSPARLKAVGKGSAEPVNVADPQAAENRRVRVVTLE